MADLIERAVQSLRNGQTDRAERDLRSVLRKRPRDADALHLLGLVELKRGRFPRAVALIERAVKEDPRVWFFHNNLGDALRQAGRPQDALTSFDRALELKQDYPEALNGRGSALRDLGRESEARISYHRALELQPGWAPVLTNLGSMVVRADPVAALEFYEAAERSGPSPDLDHRTGAALLAAARQDEGIRRLARAVMGDRGNLDYRRSLTHALYGSRMGAPDPFFIDFLTEALHDPNLPTEPLVVPALSLLEVIPPTAAALEGAPLTEDVPLLRALLSAQLVPDIRLQALVARLRHEALQDPGAADPALIAAVALQCYDSDYAAECPDQDAVDALRAHIAKATPGTKLEPALLVLAAYQRLADLENAEAIASFSGWSDHARPVLQATLVGPLEDAHIAPEIPAITTVEDTVSVDVKAHYETNPYPRWRRCGTPSMGSLLDHLRRRPGFEPPPSWPHRPRVLVAGCGTGQQPVDLARAFREISVLAVDLSRPSLAYAVRMAHEFGVAERVEFAQADLLRLGTLDERFEVVESVGVLHHLADPLQGWQVLRRLVQPRGFMRIGLYSERGRRHIVAAREAIAEAGLRPIPADIRSFRRRVLEDPELEHLRPLTFMRDFHDLSMCRDLLFHAHEHRFSVPELAEHLETLGLRFLGFEFQDQRTTRNFQFTHPGEWDNLEAWSQWEAEHPDTFLGMYQFYCQAVD